MCEFYKLKAMEAKRGDNKMVFDLSTSIFYLKQNLLASTVCAPIPRSNMIKSLINPDGILPSWHPNKALKRLQVQTP